MSNANAKGLIQIIQETQPLHIAALDVVKQKFVSNFNACHPGNQGELMYHRQMIYFNQTLAGNDNLKNADQFSLYACFVTAAVKNWSFDPADNEVYLIARAGKAGLQPQAGAYVRRLMETNQIVFAEQAVLVFIGDDFSVEKGRVTRHSENFKSEKVIAAYVRFVLDDRGNDRYFVYRPSDWNSWKEKSPTKTGPNWTGGFEGQPQPGFLRTKIVLHACKEKCWATGQRPVGVDQFENVVVEDADEVEITDNNKAVMNIIKQPAAIVTPKQQPINVPSADNTNNDDEEFAKQQTNGNAGVKIEDDNF